MDKNQQALCERCLPKTFFDNRLDIIYRVTHFEVEKEKGNVEVMKPSLQADLYDIKSIYRYIVGFTYYTYDIGRNMLQIDHLFIRKRYRKQGFATTLINNIKLRAPSMMIRVDASINITNLRLFFGCGFFIAKQHQSTISLNESAQLSEEIKQIVYRTQDNEEMVIIDTILDTNRYRDLFRVEITEKGTSSSFSYKVSMIFFPK